METDIKKRESKNAISYADEDIDIAYEFGAGIKKEVGDIVKAVVLFGSKARKAEHRKSDIDMLVVLDDVAVYLNEELVQTYRIIVRNLVGKISKRLHVTTFKFTSFWEYVRNGDPVAVNILRDGVPIIDTEFFRPLQLLLYQGRIRPTPEAVWAYYYKSPKTLENSRFKLLDACVDLYWAVVDAAHGALMTIGEIPPSPSHVAEILDEKLVAPGLLEKKYSTTMKHFYELTKKIERRQLDFIDGKTYDRNFKKATEFVDRMKTFIEEN